MLRSSIPSSSANPCQVCATVAKPSRQSKFELQRSGYAAAFSNSRAAAATSATSASRRDISAKIIDRLIESAAFLKYALNS
jgi:hypothetical protein